MIDPRIIREYDIRGIYTVTLKEKDAFLVGYSFAQYLKKEYPSISHTVSVCRDGRLSAPQLASFLISGLLEGGVGVYDIGIGPTPLLYFSNFVSDMTAGIMVTGSHNPSEYNGFKFIVQKKSFFGSKIKELFEISKRFNDVKITNNTKKKHTRSFEEKYIERLLLDCVLDNKTKIIWDCGNGAVGNIMQSLAKKMPGKHIVLNGDIDGNFPAHHPDPTVLKNLRQLIEKVKEEKADLGVAFDGDGDRIGVVDSKGRVVWGDQILSILAKDVLSRQPNAPIIADVKASKVLFDQIKKYGGEPVMWKTGHSHIKQKMSDIKSPLAGEMSGHIFIADKYYGFDDALYTAVRLISYLHKSSLTLAEAYDNLPKVYNTTEIRVQCDDDKKFKIVEELKSYFDNNKIPYNNIDGIRFDFEGGWGLIRASNTQDVLVCRFEASSREKIHEQFNMVSSLLKEFGLLMDSGHLVING